MHARHVVLLLTLWQLCCSVYCLGLASRQHERPRKGTQKTTVVAKPKQVPRAPRTVFVAVMSARGSEVKRNGSRPLWHRIEGTGHAKAKYIICNDTSKDEDPAGVTQALQREQAKFNDMVFLRCEEGYSQGRLTLKVLASLRYFHNRRQPMDLFMKVDDDTFVAWSRLYKHINELRDVRMKYIGHPLGPCNATRDPNNRWYEPVELYPNTSYPKTMAGGVGYLLGRGLVHEIIMDKSANPKGGLLWNEDRATAVWVKDVAERNASVRTVNFRAYPYTMACNSTWAAYPFWAQGSLSSHAITCLARADAENHSGFQLAQCFSRECSSGPGWMPWERYVNSTLDIPTGCHVLNDSAVKGVYSPTRC